MKVFRLCIIAATLGTAGALAATVAAPAAPGQPRASCLDRATGVRLTPGECAALGLDVSGNPLKTGPSPTSGSDAGPFPPALSNNGVVTAQAQSPQPVTAPLPARAPSAPVAPPAARPAAPPAAPAATARAVGPAMSPTRQRIIEEELDRAEREAASAKAQADAASGTANPR